MLPPVDITKDRLVESGVCAGLRIEGFWREHYEKCQTIVLPEQPCDPAPSLSS